jgi:hypothetical protein
MSTLFAVRTWVRLLGSLGVAATLIAATTIWALLHDPVGLTITPGNVLMPIVRLIGHAVVDVARNL